MISGMKIIHPERLKRTGIFFDLNRTGFQLTGVGRHSVDDPKLREEAHDVTNGVKKERRSKNSSAICVAIAGVPRRA
jgi:hypothetical protein